MTYRKKKNYLQQDIGRFEFLKAMFLGVLLVVGIAYLFYGTIFAAILLSPYIYWHMRSWKVDLVRKRQQNFRGQFKEAIQSISAALSVGYSVENALREATADLETVYAEDELIIQEMQFMVRQVQMNVTVEKVLQDFAIRMKDEDVHTFVTVFTMAKRSGGDTMEIIRDAARQMGDKIDVEREIVTILAARKLEFRIMTLIPLGMIVYLRLSFPEFFQVLYGNLLGVVIMTVCLLIYLLAYLSGKKIVEIEV